MRTARLLTVCRGGGLCPWDGCVCRGGGVCRGGVSASGPKGVCHTPGTWGRHPPPWTDRHLWKHNLRKLRLRAVKRGLLFCPIKLKLIYMEKDKSVLVNNDIFLSIPSAQPQELITCKFWRFINCIGVYWVCVCDFLTCWQIDWSVIFYLTDSVIVFPHLLPPANEVCEGNVFTGVCLSTGGMRDGRGACVAGETATAAGGTHPTGMHSCNSRFLQNCLWNGMRIQFYQI